MIVNETNVHQTTHGLYVQVYISVNGQKVTGQKVTGQKVTGHKVTNLVGQKVANNLWTIV